MKGMTVSASSMNSELERSPIQATLRDCTPQGKGILKLKQGEIAFIDSSDITRREAEQLVVAGPVAVVNLARFSTGSIPNYGPHLLLDAGIRLFESAGSELRAHIRDGKKASITEDGVVSIGRKVCGQATPVGRLDIDETFIDAQRHLIDHMEAFFGNTIEFIHSESPLLIDGVGSPELGDSMSERKVVVVSPCDDLRERMRGLKNFIREFNPVLIGVGRATDTLSDLGYAVEYIVGDPLDVSAENLRSDARVILPADPDGYATGLERIQDLGVGAMTFPAATESATDLAILLAVFHDAETVVTVGETVELDRIFADTGSCSPASLLVRLKAGARLVDSRVIAKMYNVPSGRSVAWAWAILGVLVAIATLVLIVGLGGDSAFSDNLVNTWNAFALRAQSWFR